MSLPGSFRWISPSCMISMVSSPCSRSRSRSWRSRRGRCPRCANWRRRCRQAGRPASLSPIWMNSPSSILRKVPSWMTSDRRSPRAAATSSRPRWRAIGVDAVVDREGDDAGQHGKQHHRADNRHARTAGGADHDQLRIVVHHRQRLRDGDDHREGHDRPAAPTAGSARRVSKNANADWPLSVTRLMRARICVVHTIASVHARDAQKSIKARRKM